MDDFAEFLRGLSPDDALAATNDLAMFGHAFVYVVDGKKTLLAPQDVYEQLNAVDQPDEGAVRYCNGVADCTIAGTCSLCFDTKQLSVAHQPAPVTPDNFEQVLAGVLADMNAEDEAAAAATIQTDDEI